MEQKKRKKRSRGKGLMYAIPPEDYKGSVAAWMVGLQERGLWDGQNPEWHGEVRIPLNIYVELLESCEK